MDTINREILLGLLDREPAPCVSLYMPLHIGPDARQDPVRLKNLLNQAEAELTARGAEASWATGLTAQLRSDSESQDWWEQGGQGLAVFIAEGFSAQYRLSLPLAEQLRVGDSFAVKPLLPALSEAGHFYILGLSENAPRLLLATRDEVSEMELAGAPVSLNDHMKLEDREEHLQMHSTGSPQSGDGAGMFHGGGSWNDEEKKEIPGYLKALGDAVNTMLQADGAPLIIAGVDHMVAMFRKSNSYAGLVEPHVQGNVDDMPPKQLQASAWEKIEPVLHSWEETAAARLDDLLGTGLALSGEAEIVAAAHQGRISTLLVAADEEQWGQWNDETQTATLADGPGSDAKELTEDATAWTLRTGAIVVSRPKAAIPGGGSMAAILRY